VHDDTETLHVSLDELRVALADWVEFVGSGN
jgi:hypothetical protein